MPQFHAYDLIKWLHFVTLVLGGGGAMVAFLLMGLEEDQNEYKGLSAALWKKVVVWSFRLAVLLGIVLLVMQFREGLHPFAARYLHYKLTLVVVLAAVSEMAPGSLAKGKRGAASLVILLFLLSTFVVFTKRTWGGRILASAPYSDPNVPVLKGQ